MMEQQVLEQTVEPDITDGLTSDDVDEFYENKRLIIATQDPDQLYARMASLGIDIGDPTAYPTTKDRKELFNLWFAREFPQTVNREEHLVRLQTLLGKIQNHFADHDSESGLVVTGSFANGYINGTQSDLDFVVFVPEREEELEAYANLKDIGIVTTNKLGSVDDIKPLIETGHGHSKILGLTEEGIEVELFLIGMQDAEHMHTLHPGYVERVKPTYPKNELRTAVTGERRSLLKPPDVVPHYIRDTDGRVFSGFLTANTLTGEVVYDPQGHAEQIRDNVWEAYVKSYIYNNGGYDRTNGTTYLRPDVLDFDKFIGTFYYNRPTSYAPERLDVLKQKFDETVEGITDKLNLHRLPPLKPATFEYTNGHEHVSADQKIDELKEQGISMWASDYDGTLYGHNYRPGDVATLVGHSSRQDIVPAVISARDATAKRELLPEIQRELALRGMQAPVYMGLANGKGLYKVEAGGIEPIYEFGLDDDDIRRIMDAYGELGIEVTDPMDSIRQKSLKANWNNLIPPHLLDLAAGTKGFWAEPLKASVRLPDEKNLRLEAVDMLSQFLDGQYDVGWSGGVMADVTRSIGTDGKLYAARTLMDINRTCDAHVGTFGDMPHGNDKGLLSLPYSFTNNEQAPLRTNNTPPYLLTGTGNAVHRVHETVRKLVNSS